MNSTSSLLSSFALLPMSAWSAPLYNTDLQMGSLTVTSQSTPDSSPSTSPRPLKRGRPQQEIDDAGDAGSQRRKHRRLYAREYRAQMRKKVDEVEVLREKVDSLQRERALSEAKRIEMEMKCAQLEKQLYETAQKEAALSTLLSSILVSSIPISTVPTSSFIPVSTMSNVSSISLS